MRLSEQLTSQEVQKLETLLHGLKTFNDNECRFNLDKGFEAYKFKFSKGSIKLNGIGVRSLHMFCNKRDAWLFEIKFYENTDIKYMILDTEKLSLRDFVQIFNKVILGKSLINHAFAEDYSHTFNWKTRSVERLYDPMLLATYTTRIYPSLAHTLDKVISDIQRDNTVCILSVGCGNGDELIALNEILSKRKIQAYIGGFDINQTNVANAIAKTKDLSVKQSCFVKGDIKQTGQLIPSIKQTMNVPENTPTIVVFCGVLTPGIVQQHLVAMQIVQKVKAHCDYVMLNGYEPVILNKRVLKCIGFDHMQQGEPIADVTSPSALSCKQTNIYKVQSKERRREIVQKHSKKRTRTGMVIDLQMSASVLEDIQLLLEHNKQDMAECTQLDISRASIDGADHDAIMQLLTENFLAKPKILVAGDEAWLKPLGARLMKSGHKILKRLETKYANMSVNMFSIPVLRRFKENHIPVDDGALQICEYK